MTETSLGIRLLFSCFDAGTGKEACFKEMLRERGCCPEVLT